MLMSVLAELSIGLLLTRVATTAIVVIGVAAAVARLGPRVGGALAGLPIVLGPGFLFLILQGTSAFVAEAALHALISLCSTQVFLLAYITAASRAGPFLSLLAAGAGWVASAAIFRFVPATPFIAVALFLSVTAAAHILGRGFVRTAGQRSRRERLGLLLLRGLLAGLLVAVVTAVASRLGAAGSGLLLAFPIGYTVLSVTIHEQLGSEIVSATLHSALLGTVSLGGFCTALALAMPVLPPGWSYLGALAFSLGITLALVLRARAGNRAHK